MQTPLLSLLLRERRRGLGMYGRASVASVAKTSLGTNESFQYILLARNFSMTEIWICCHAPLRL